MALSVSDEDYSRNTYFGLWIYQDIPCALSILSSSNEQGVLIRLLQMFVFNMELIFLLNNI